MRDDGLAAVRGSVVAGRVAVVATRGGEDPRSRPPRLVAEGWRGRRSAAGWRGRRREDTTWAGAAAKAPISGDRLDPSMASRGKMGRLDGGKEDDLMQQP